MRVVVAAALTLITAQTLTAQTPDLRRSGLPRDQATRLERLIEDPGTRREEGDVTIRRSETVDGNLYVHRGILTVAGTVRGEIVAVDADVYFEEGASVSGDITVIGGAIHGTDDARLAGTVTEFGEGFGLLAGARRIHDGRDDWRGNRAGWRGDDDWDDHDRWDWGNAGFRVGVGQNYNRVEGLPIQFGPDLRTGGSFPMRLQALAIWRTDVGPLTDSKRFGYSARVEQFLGRDLRLGASVRSTIDAIESWYLDDLEASLSTAMLHEDQRDYFKREGWSAYVRLAPHHSPLDLMVEYRDEHHYAAAARDPWTLFNTDDLWREQPLVGEGRLRSVNALLTVDTRNRGDFTYRGWYVGASVTRGVDGELTMPAAVDFDGLALEPRTFDSNFTTGVLDIRHFEPIGWEGAIGLRAIGGGAFDRKALAPQFQHALGGVGTLPGYDLLGADCGARGAAVETGAGAFFFPSYGCDRFAMVQAEYRGGIGGFHTARRGHDWHFDADFNWIVFFDVGRGWVVGDDPSRSDTETLYDAGAGVILGGFGIYGAAPLNGNDRGVRFFVRLGPRF